MNNKENKLFEASIVNEAIISSFFKLNPITLMKNPVMFIVEIGAVMTSIIFLLALFKG